VGLGVGVAFRAAERALASLSPGVLSLSALNMTALSFSSTLLELPVLSLDILSSFIKKNTTAMSATQAVTIKAMFK
jgi:hypothetical protein